MLDDGLTGSHTKTRFLAAIKSSHRITMSTYQKEERAEVGEVREVQVMEKVSQ